MSKALPSFNLEQYLPYRLTVIASHLSAKLASQYKKQYGISIPEWRVLLNVAYSENVSVRDIEKRVSLEKSKVSRAASKLEAKGYLTKRVDHNDRRLLKLVITDQGVALLNELIPLAQAFQSELNTILGDQEETLHLALDRLGEQEE